MGSVWFVIPSKRPMGEAHECFQAWRERGYKIGIAREDVDGMPYADLILPVHTYLGWARSTNLLIGHVMADDPTAEWFIGGGDDYYPDPNHTAEEIAAECSRYFLELNIANRQPFLEDHDSRPVAKPAVNHLFGVMQPTGDRWMNGVIDRIAGSPWMGREFCRRMYNGAGPMFNGYYHNFADEELQNVAQKYGVFWQRRDLTQEHRHWARPRGDWRDAPEWAHKINNPQLSDWDKSKALFAQRKGAGFPGSEPLEL